MDVTKPQCPESGKIYILILFCLVFTSILTSINAVSKSETNYQIIDDNLFGIGIAINIIQTMFTLFLIKVDMFDKCNKFVKCGNNCKWLNFNNAKYPIILLSSAYMIGFGIINIFQKSNIDTEQDLTMISIASFIAGVIGMLYILGDLVCSVGCGF
jgi:hypothetical protein